MSTVTEFLQSMLQDPNNPGPFWTQEETGAWANEYWHIRQAKHEPEEENAEASDEKITSTAVACADALLFELAKE